MRSAGNVQRYCVTSETHLYTWTSPNQSKTRLSNAHTHTHTHTHEDVNIDGRLVKCSLQSYHTFWWEQATHCSSEYRDVAHRACECCATPAKRACESAKIRERARKRDPHSYHSEPRHIQLTVHCGQLHILVVTQALHETRAQHSARTARHVHSDRKHSFEAKTDENQVRFSKQTLCRLCAYR